MVSAPVRPCLGTYHTVPEEELIIDLTVGITGTPNSYLYEIKQQIMLGKLNSIFKESGR
jgi:hypothetical protein